MELELGPAGKAIALLLLSLMALCATIDFRRRGPSGKPKRTAVPGPSTPPVTPASPRSSRNNPSRTGSG